MKTEWVLAVAVILLSGCTDPLTKLINERFPPISIEQQRQTAIDTTAEALSVLQTPNIAFSISLSDAEKALNTEALHNQGVTDLKISSEKQLVHIHAAFNRKFTEADAGDNTEARKILERLRPEISGTIDAYTGLSGAVATNTATEPELQIRLLPGLSRVEVEKVSLAEKLDVTKLSEILAGLLTKYRDNVTGELSRAPFSRITVPAVSDKPVDMSKTLKVTSPGKAYTVVVKANPVKMPVMLAGIAWLIDENSLTALLQFSPQGGSPPPATVKIGKTFEAIDGQINGLVNSAFGIKDPLNSTWVAVRKDLLAFTINNAMTQASACMSAAGKSHESNYTKIPMPDENSINCSSDRNCESTRTCSFEANHDTRDCSACIISAPRLCSPRVCAFGGCIGGGCTGGQCVQRGNDPICELAKAAQNQAYLVDANLRKADCDRLRAMETAGCQAEELGKKALCETGKIALRALRKTGNFANLDVEADVSSDNLNICIRDFSLSPGLENVRFHLDVTGNAAADTKVKFVPLDIVGHLTCQIPWTERVRFTAELREPSIGINSAIKINAAQEKPQITFTIDETTVKGKLSPGPTEFLVKSPTMMVSCAGLNLIKPLVVVLTPFIPALQGSIDHKIERQEASMDLSLPVAKVGNLGMQTAGRETPQALVLTSTASKGARTGSGI